MFGWPPLLCDFSLPDLRLGLLDPLSQIRQARLGAGAAREMRHHQDTHSKGGWSSEDEEETRTAPRVQLGAWDVRASLAARYASVGARPAAASSLAQFSGTTLCLVRLADRLEFEFRMILKTSLVDCVSGSHSFWMSVRRYSAWATGRGLCLRLYCVRDRGRSRCSGSAVLQHRLQVCSSRWLIAVILSCLMMHDSVCICCS